MADQPVPFLDPGVCDELLRRAQEMAASGELHRKYWPLLVAMVERGETTREQVHASGLAAAIAIPGETITYELGAATDA